MGTGLEFGSGRSEQVTEEEDEEEKDLQFILPSLRLPNSDVAETLV